MSPNKAESKGNGEETSSQGSNTYPQINTQTVKCNKYTSGFCQLFVEMNLEEPVPKRSRAKRRRAKRRRAVSSSQGTSTQPRISTRSRKIHKLARDPEKSTNQKNKENIENNACGKCGLCGNLSYLSPPKITTSEETTSSGGSISFLSKSFVNRDVPTSSSSSVNSTETTAASKTNVAAFMEMLYGYYDNGKLNDEDLINGQKLFKEDTEARNMWFQLNEELQIGWIKGPQS